MPGLASWHFFFQAEDGIRDHCVTGVQTCALPIYSVPKSTPDLTVPRDASALAPASTTSTTSTTGTTTTPTTTGTTTSAAPTTTSAAPARSEERRVGKSVDLGGRRNVKRTTGILGV